MYKNIIVQNFVELYRDMKKDSSSLQMHLNTTLRVDTHRWWQKSVSFL